MASRCDWRGGTTGVGNQHAPQRLCMSLGASSRLSGTNFGWLVSHMLSYAAPVHEDDWAASYV
jgi:hypothetical protein